MKSQGNLNGEWGTPGTTLMSYCLLNNLLNNHNNNNINTVNH